MELVTLKRCLNKLTRQDGFYMLCDELNLIHPLIINGSIKCIRNVKKDGTCGKWAYVKIGYTNGAKQLIKEFNSILTIKINQQNKKTVCCD